MKDRLIRLFQPFTSTEQGRNRVERVPTDLVATIGFVVVATLALTVVDVTSTLVRAAVGVPLLFLAPGYATVSALFPRASPTRRANATALIEQTRHVGEGERWALAFGLSFALLPLLGLAIAASPWALSPTVVVWTTSAYVLLGASIAAVRRARVPAEDRYRFGFGRKLAAIRAAVFDTRSSAHTLLNVVLVCSMLLALTTVGYALVSPQQGERYTELQLLTEDESGDLVASGYPSTVEPGESVSFAVSVENREGREMDYTVVVQEQWVADGEVIDRAELERVDYAVGDGETTTGEREVTPNAESGEVRIAVLLYDGDAPDEPTTENAYRYGHFWIDVTEPVDDADEE